MPWITRMNSVTIALPLPLLQFGHGTDACDHVGPEATFDGNAVMLQFGHGTDAVDHISFALSACGGLSMLQFGHGTDAVDHKTSPGCSPPSARPRFNSATAL